MKKLTNFFLDFLPLLIFFLVNKNSGIITATIAIVATTPITTLIYYILNKKIPRTQVITLFFILLFGSLTIAFNDEIFIKIKPTLINLTLALILFLGLLSGKFFLKMLLSPALNLTERGWRIATNAWIIFFLFLAVINEVVWRIFSTDTWVSFKVFGILPITFLFTIILFLLISRHIIEKNNTYE
ncbi:MAG: hypothetical protein CBC47_07740 [Alphaproteobacteria bacterium TMED87]|nr:septation protein A [Rhodospirillaceae bacterium]OUV08349.1 MAG: hypothetical protein CBC47_07740 [Alphaproteobacteria bacterium TMED87]